MLLLCQVQPRHLRLLLCSCATAEPWQPSRLDKTRIQACGRHFLKCTNARRGGALQVPPSIPERGWPKIMHPLTRHICGARPRTSQEPSSSSRTLCQSRQNFSSTQPIMPLSERVAWSNCSLFSEEDVISSSAPMRCAANNEIHIAQFCDFM